MSGISLALGPGIEAVDKAAEPTSGAEATTQLRRKQQEAAAPVALLGGPMSGSLRVIELQLVAFIFVFSVSGLIPLLDLVFPALTSAYIIILSRFVFPAPHQRSSDYQLLPAEQSWFFQLYIILGTSIGLFLPLAYVLGGFARGDELAVRSATPHLFLLSFQILTENIITGLSLFSAPVRAFVPLLYTVRRIFVIFDWVHKTMPLPANGPSKDMAWFWFGRILAIGNLVYFSINLLGFLIPRFLPKAFEIYFMERNQLLCSETVEKKQRKSD
ncbi:hypothetical protein Dimus_035716 [Dionaea muscipula]